jgi:transcription initiation factor TFIID subunit TAF12
LQLEDGAVDLFSNTIKEDGLLIDMEVPEKPMTLDVYVQGWHNQIWEHGFFKGKDSYSKSKAFQDQRQTDLDIKRVVFK